MNYNFNQEQTLWIKLLLAIAAVASIAWLVLIVTQNVWR